MKENNICVKSLTGFSIGYVILYAGIYVKAKTQGSVITSLLVNLKATHDRLIQAEERITATEQFNPIGSILAFPCELSQEQLRYFRVCDGTLIDTNSKEEDGRWRTINEILFNLGRAQERSEPKYINFDTKERYHLPDLNGRTIVGVGRPSGANDMSPDTYNLGESVGNQYHKLTADESGLPNHQHQVDVCYTHHFDGGHEYANASWHDGTTGGVIDGEQDAKSSHINMQPSLVLIYAIRILK